MKKQPTTRSFCRECHQTTWHMVVSSVLRKEIEEECDPPTGPIISENLYQLLQCLGCDCVTMRRSTVCEQLYGSSPLVNHFPPFSARHQPSWTHQLPGPVFRLMLEVYQALTFEGMRLAVMGARTLVDMAILDKVGDVGTFLQKLEQLEKQGFIGKRNREILAAALEAGNASAHRGHQFNTDQVNQVMDIVENLLQAIYILSPAAESLKQSTPPRKKAAK